MLALVRLALSLGGRRAGLFGAHAQARAAQLGLLAAFGLAGTVFLLALITTALAYQVGAVAALAIMTGLCALGCVGVYVAMRSERRAHDERLRRQSIEDRRLLQIGLLTAVPVLKRGGAIAAAAGLLALLLLPRRDRDDDA